MVIRADLLGAVALALFALGALNFFKNLFTWLYQSCLVFKETDLDLVILSLVDIVSSGWVAEMGFEFSSLWKFCQFESDIEKAKKNWVG